MHEPATSCATRAGKRALLLSSSTLTTKQAEATVASALSDLGIVGSAKAHSPTATISRNAPRSPTVTQLIFATLVGPITPFAVRVFLTSARWCRLIPPQLSRLEQSVPLAGCG